MKHCAGRVLLWSLCFYALAALALNLVMDRWCPNLAESLYRTKWEGLCRLTTEAPDRPLVVMLGSSRADGNFQAGRLDGLSGPDGQPLAAYNFGIPKAGPIHEYLHLREMLDQGIRPRLLLVEFLPPLFNDSHTRLAFEENWTEPEWVTGRQFVRMAPYFIHPVRKGGVWLEARLAPWYVFRPLLPLSPLSPWGTSGESAPDPYPRDRWGCRCPEPLTPEERSRRWEITRQYIPSLERFKLGTKPVQAMRDLLACSRREHIPTALVLAPESQEFRSWYTPQCRAALRDFLAELQADYGVEVLDASAWLEDDDDFMDGHHLNDSGATKFTARLLTEVQRILR
ncbi:MAG TPA: DUF1574 family protein [Gemmataceae bacterium]|jgi:hypothetical protein